MSIIERCRTFANYLGQHKHHCAAAVLILIWCLPYIFSGNNVEWGDFGFFAQGAEAIRASIVNYHQFPWFNPWVAGGVPLYANPQFGVFSIQTVLSLLFGAVMGLKLAMILYTVGGYAAMYLLVRKYFKLGATLSTVLSLLWIFSSFFVSHLPAHYTFAWYMLGPLFVYLALTIKTWRGGAVMGLAFAIMGLAQIHYAFVHIALICAVILAVRLIRGKTSRRDLLLACVAAAGVFLVIAGHRLLFTLENIREFPRVLLDNATNPVKSVLGVLLPYSSRYHLYEYPSAAFGWGELTATIGICANVAVLLSVWFLARRWRKNPKPADKKPLLYAAWLLAIALFIFAVGLGSTGWWSPYSLLKHLPVFGDMRVASRLFVWFLLLQLVFAGYMVQHAPVGRYRRVAKGLLALGVIELFILNAGYQFNVLSHPAITAPQPQTAYQFVQVQEFNESGARPDGTALPSDGAGAMHYREYEATTFNMGVLRANDALVDTIARPLPLCSIAKGCGLVASNNAAVTYWSPNKIVLRRTGPGNIMLNANNSNYFVVNGKRNAAIRTAEPYSRFVLAVTDDVQDITIQVQPDVGVAAAHLFGTH